jgi:probable HAF family extracellular repeat protein
MEEVTMSYLGRRACAALRTLVVVGLFAFPLVPTTAGSVGASASAARASFQGLGQMPGACCGTYASGISGDGSTIVGDAYVALNSSKTEAYRWTAPGGYQLLGDLGSADTGSAAYATSFDGAVVVGDAPVGTNSFGAFRWTAAQGMKPLPMNDAFAVTDDGSMVAGDNAWWRTSGQTGTFGSCGDAPISLSMGDLSADGSVAAGFGPFGTPFMGDHINAYRATPTGNCQNIDGHSRNSDAGGISADGQVIVGEMQIGGPYQAFRWTASTGPVVLGDLGGGLSRADATNRDGSVVVGHSLTSGSTGSAHAFIWTATCGMQDLQAMLKNQGARIPNGWTLQIATDISEDGTVIAGYGISPPPPGSKFGGPTEPWRAVLPAVC